MLFDDATTHRLGAFLLDVEVEEPLGLEQRVDNLGGVEAVDGRLDGVGRVADALSQRDDQHKSGV